MSRLTTGNKYKSQLLQLREARRNVDRDAQLLANRIALLEAEEKKAWKKIQSTKERAEAILRTRQENKEERMMAKRKIAMNQEKRNLDAKYLEREISRQNRSKEQKQKDEKARKEARAMKAEKLKMEKLRRKQDEEIRRKNKQKQMKIKKEKLNAQMKRKKLAADKARRSKGVYDEKVGNELNKRKEVESRVAKMERMEMELIKRLQNTQALQQQAYQQLETALNPR